MSEHTIIETGASITTGAFFLDMHAASGSFIASSRTRIILYGWRLIDVGVLLLLHVSNGRNKRVAYNGLQHTGRNALTAEGANRLSILCNCTQYLKVHFQQTEK